ncbi:MAG: glycoside hydrolase family 25 protein [Chloroflexota bacterium]|nr:glycoside hydrolase family 25 protein [Chloroflexota bacterium]
MAAVPGIDVSSNQGVIDWAQVAAAGQKYAFIRSSMGRGGVDKRFSTNFRQAQEAGLLVGLYHLVRPEWRGVEQIDHLMATVADRKPDFPLVLDVELDGTDLIPPQPKSVEEITACVRECVNVLETRGARKPIIYTGGWFWNKKITPSSEWDAYDLWVAHYGSTAPSLPLGWTDWKFWQYSDKGRVPGLRGDVDMNWFDGTLEDLIRYAKGDVVVDKPAVLRARVTAAALNIRKAPDLRAEDIGDLKSGDVIEIKNVGGKGAWIEFKPGQWAAIAFNGTRFMEWIPGTPPRARVTAPLINVRNGADMKYTDIGDLLAAEMLDVLNLDGADVWIELAPGQWAAFAVNGRTFMELIRT